MPTFPFGNQVTPVQQQDQTPKRVFVLGVYASAVHARWLGPDGRERIKAVAVASEPEIFWRGDAADRIIARIRLPPEAGRLEPAAPQFNGPSGRALDQHFLRPLGFARGDAWLSDLLPESRCNPSQAQALARAYAPVQHLLPTYSWPAVPRELASAPRVDEIADEVVRSGADIFVTLGDLPLRHFASRFGAHSTLGAYGKSHDSYGRRLPISIAGHQCELLPLVHPRQAATLGHASRDWAELHRLWVDRQTSQA